MRFAKFQLGLLLAFLLISAHSAAAQLAPGADDPLARIRAAAAGAAACSATGESLCEQVAPKIIANAEGESPLAENVRQLSEIIKHAGETQSADAVSWAVAAFHGSGLEPHTEKYSIPVTWSGESPHLQILAPSRFSVPIAAVGWTPATPGGGLEARVVFANEGSEADFVKLGPSARGAIVLIHSEAASETQILKAYANAPAVVRRAAAAGAVAILWMSIDARKLTFRPVNTLTGRLDPMPQAIVARGDALDIEDVLLAGQKVRVRLDLPNHVGGPAERENVVAEIRGRELPDEWILLGARLDSDDACDAALVVEAARDIVRISVKPRRSIRFVLFTSDEPGMLGAWSYVRTHRDELDRARAAIIFGRSGFADGCSGGISGYSLGGRMDMKAPVLDAMKPLASLGVNTYTLDSPIDADTLDFLLEGIPTLLANETRELIPNAVQGGQLFTTPPQSGLNELLKRNTAIAGVTAFSVAELPMPLGPRLNRAAIERLLHDSGLAERLQDTDLWGLWQTGDRGRLP